MIPRSRPSSSSVHRGTCAPCSPRRRDGEVLGRTDIGRTCARCDGVSCVASRASVRFCYHWMREVCHVAQINRHLAQAANWGFPFTHVDFTRISQPSHSKKPNRGLSYSTRLTRPRSLATRVVRTLSREHILSLRANTRTGLHTREKKARLET